MENTLVMALGIVMALGLARRVFVRRRATLVNPTGPEWRAAVRQAQATVGAARDLLAAAPGSVLVKYALANQRGDREHVWGELLHINDGTFTAKLDSPLIEGGPRTSPPYTLALSELEDWVRIAADGSVRGGFSIQAEIACAKAAGQRLSRQAQALEGRFVDILGRPS